MNRESTAHSATIDLLTERGVEYVFGNPGTTELPFVASLGDIEYVMCLQESIAVAAATGYSLVRGTPAVVNLHALPGVGHAMGALHGARLMHAPVVVIAGQQSSGHLHREPLLSGDLVGTVRPAVKWAEEVRRSEDVPRAVERAFRVASMPPTGPAFVSVPMDLWEGTADGVEVAGSSRPVPASRDLERIRHLLAGSRRGALVTGDRVNDAASWEAAQRLADEHDLTCYAAPIGTQPGFPTTHPRFRGHLPLTPGGTRDALSHHDVVLVVGAPVFTAYLDDGAHPLPDTTMVALVSEDPAELARAPVPIAVLGDPGQSLEALAPPPDSKADRTDEAPPIEQAAPSLELSAVADTIGRLLPSDTVVVDESMTAGSAVRRSVRIASPRSYLRTSTGVLGTGLPAAIGAGLAAPGRRVAAVIGDGSTMYAPQALWTIARHRLRVTTIVLNNGGYESLRGFVATRMTGAGLGRTAFDLPGVDLAALADSLGVAGTRVAAADELEPALETALASDEPTLVDIALA